MDSELLMRLVRARLDGDVSEDDFNAIRRGLELARSDDQDGEGEDEGVDSEICALIIQTIDALAAKQARLERALAAVDPDAFARGDEAGLRLTFPPATSALFRRPSPSRRRWSSKSTGSPASERELTVGKSDDRRQGGGRREVRQGQQGQQRQEARDAQSPNAVRANSVEERKGACRRGGRLRQARRSDRAIDLRQVSRARGPAPGEPAPPASLPARGKRRAPARAER